ncbi:zona pellucida sperm-binding protein 3-like [Hemiscyllium ocellatum]|uniref:zona pellucida sperm-binding protein 3-like n=1 Tax=Hemiscyllium ocellatum TaxID=170820 RepID=UPI0029662FAF|nr:zona pellucida sperm-binding protein 3-like [Hemiscyllium ocellatum]
MIEDFLIYTTHLTHIPNYPGSVIVRTNGAVVPIECRYLRKGNVSSNPINPTWIPFSSTRSGEGHLTFSLRLMNGDWLTERTSTVYYLGELIHIEASVSLANHVSLKLYIDRCVATLSPDKDSTLRYSIIDYNGCLLDSKAEDSFSTFVLPRDGREPDKLQFDLDAFRFYGDERSLIFITCHLRVAAVDQGDSRNKACTFQKLERIWRPLEGSDSDICACCHVGNCGSPREILFPSRRRRDLGPEAESEAGLEWEGEASLGPLIILDTELTNLATQPLTEGDGMMQERSPSVASWTAKLRTPFQPPFCWEPDKLRFELDAFRFHGDERSLMFITCHLRVAAVDQGDSRNKACTFQKLEHIWRPLEGSDSDICACCHVGNCGSTRSSCLPPEGKTLALKLVGH